MRLNSFALIIALPIMLLGCSGEKPPAPPPAPSPAQPSVFDQQRKAIEAAKSVEGTLKEHDEARRRLIDGESKP